MGNLRLEQALAGEAGESAGEAGSGTGQVATRQVARIDYAFAARGTEAHDSLPFEKVHRVDLRGASGFEIALSDGGRLVCDLRARTLTLVEAGGRTDRLGCPFPSLAAALRSGPDEQDRRWEAAAFVGETAAGEWRSPIDAVRRVELEP